ncbi:MAG: RnfABCDGE type electron transport complex subunit D [Myxacorys californica WJT36-NPBG1]|jgi:Na+-transporting NADH:ubiquinone oxidoreductase subunit NqrB|nr:RnfABCDGE type electron transport complex subunit D [Myxacorys californica WJT36-NPBG1]
MAFQDARLVQILFLSTFLFLGFWTRDWTLRSQVIGVAIAACLLTQFAVQRYREDQPFTPQSFLSPLITSLGLSLLLRVDHCSTMALAGGAAILSKSVFQVGGKHVFNPANFGIVMALLLTGDAWVSPGQWGEEGWYVVLFLATGGLVVGKVGRWDTTLAFLGMYAGLEAVRNVWLGWTWDVWAHRLMSGSLLMFALFMVTDPRSIPNARTGRIIWAGAIALLTFILRNYFFIPTAVFWALFALAPLTILLDRLFPDDRFIWAQNSQTQDSQLEVSV